MPPKRKIVDQPVQVDAANDEPTAVRRKRRGSPGQVDPPKKRTHTKKHETETTAEVSLATNVTPSNADKHVRFSNPQPEIIASSSTSLTQVTQQTSHTPAPPSSSAKGPIPRASLTITPSSSAPESGELHIAPLKDLVDGRVKRRLRKNHLNEEINDIDDHNREDARRKHEIEELKHDVHDRERKVRQLREELEMAKQLGTDVEADHEDAQQAVERVRELEEELLRVREEAREHAESPGYPNLENSNLGITADSTDEDIMIVNFDDETPQQTSQRTIPVGSPKLGLAEPINHVALLDLDHEATIKGLEHQIINLDAKVQHWLLAYQSWLLKLEPYILPPTPDSAEEKMDHAVHGVLSRLALTEIRASDAEAAMRALGDEVRDLGFEGEGVEEILKTVGEQFRQTRLALEYIAPGETVYGFDNSKLLQALVDRVRMLVEQVKEREGNLQKQRHEQSALRAQFNVTLQTLGSTCDNVKDLKNQLENKTSLLDTTEKKTSGLKADLGEKERSVSMLQEALEGYRTEVTKLEKLITQLETDHNAATAQLQRETGEAITDLECKVAAETKGRQAAETVVIERNKAVADLKGKLNAAQAHTDNVRAEMAALLLMKENEVAVENQGRQAAEAAAAERNEVIAELEEELTAAKGNTEDVRNEMQALLVDKEYQLAKETEGRHAAEAVAAERNNVVAQLEEKLIAAQKYTEDVTAELQALLVDRERKVAEEHEARQAAEAGIKEKTKLIAKLEKKLVTAQKYNEDVKAEMQSRLTNKEGEVMALEQAVSEKDKLHDVAMEAKDRQMDALNLETSTLTSALTDANVNIATLQAANTALEARVVEEKELGIKAVEVMQAEMMRSLARVSEVKNAYVRQTKVRKVTGALVGAELEVQGTETGGPLTPMNVVRFTDVEVTSSGKRQKMSRMNGDGGIGFVEE
ncbi:MAG: hypothetical protein M1830_003612 [Pleopsidium flavum]|nr:MAG: hypothetical protein M1830_003612 [Pleopsidium flavum]